MSNAIAVEIVATKILELRGRKVMLDKDLAKLYGVETRVLNQAVKRNQSRFPDDFMFILTREEINRISRIVISLKFSKNVYAFTEQGVAMLSSVLNSERAIQVNILIMRAFVRLKEALVNYDKLATKINKLEKKYIGHDEKLQDIFEAIRQLIASPPEEKRRIKGFDRELAFANWKT